MSDYTSRVLAAAIALVAAFAPVPPASAQQPSRVESVESQFEDEPTVRQVQKAALRASGLGTAKARRWAARARLSHVLPKLSGEVAWLDQRDVEISYREDIEADERGEMIRDSARNDFVDDERLRSIYAIEAEWDLSGLVFDPEELDAAHAAERRQLARLELLQMVSDAYFERRRWQIELALTPRANLRKRLEARVSIQRATADLDALTDGWFSRKLGRGGAP